MDDKVKENNPGYFVYETSIPKGIETEPLRDKFARSALVGLIQSETVNLNKKSGRKILTDKAYKLADDMIETRKDSL